MSEQLRDQSHPARCSYRDHQWMKGDTVLVKEPEGGLTAETLWECELCGQRQIEARAAR